MPDRLRRLRMTSELRSMTREVELSARKLIFPIFVSESANEPEPIVSMPGQFRWSLNQILEPVEQAVEAGVPAVLLFGLPKKKSENADSAFDPKGIVQLAIQKIKSAHPKMIVITDVCICAYTDHGHCGLLRGEEILNDPTLEVLAKIAVSHSQAGADIVAPSSMMDFQVLAIREALDVAGLDDTPIMAYSSKFASGFYGPFREAANSSPSFGDRSSYQHDYANPRHAKRELIADELEGADFLMVKPGLAYLDILSMARSLTDLPLVAYNVSGEYSMVKAAAEKNWLDGRKVTLEILTAFVRAGADHIITYHALEASKWLKDN